MDQEKKNKNKNSLQESKAQNALLSPNNFPEKGSPRISPKPALHKNMTIKQGNNPADKFTGQDLAQICSELKHEQYKEGEAVFKQGEYGDKFYVILKGEVAVKIPDPKRKNDPPKQLQPVIQHSVKQSVVSLAAQSVVADGESRRPTFLSAQTMKFLPETKNSQANFFITNSQDPSPKTTKFSQNVASLSQYMQQVNKAQRRSTIHNLNPQLTLNKLSVKHTQSKHSVQGGMFNKNHRSILNNDIEEGEFEDSDGEYNKPPTIKSENSDSQIDETDQPNTVSQESIADLSVENQASILARAVQEDDGFIQVAKLIDGSSFGELALLEQKPRAATIRCLQNSHFMVLTKNDYVRVIGKIERRAYNDKINFLRNIPVFSLLTRTSLGKMTYYFENKSCIRDSFLYKEGDQADYVYIIKSGEFEATKRILHTGPKAEKIEDILENPIKANKHKNNLFSKNILRKIEKINLFILGSGQLIGDEDVGVNNSHYQSTIRCLSQHAELIRLKKEDFLRLQSQGPTWNEILKSITEKKKKIQLCLLQTRASKNRIENQLDQDTVQIKDQIKQDRINNPLIDEESRFRKAKSKQHQSSQISMDFTKQSFQGMNFKDMVQMYGGGKQSNHFESFDGESVSQVSKFLEQTQNTLPTINDNRQIFQSLKNAQLSKSGDRNQMSQTIRLNANRIKTLRPQASLFPMSLIFKQSNESQISSDSIPFQFKIGSQGSMGIAQKIASSGNYNKVVMQSDEFSLRSQSHLKTKYRLRRRLEKIGLSQNYQDESKRNKNPFGQNHEKHLSMNIVNNNNIETERSLLNKTTIFSNQNNRNQDDSSLRGGDSFISSQVQKTNKTVILTKTSHHADYNL
eukprot:403374386